MNHALLFLFEVVDWWGHIHWSVSFEFHIEVSALDINMLYRPIFFSGVSKNGMLAWVFYCSIKWLKSTPMHCLCPLATIQTQRSVTSFQAPLFVLSTMLCRITLAPSGAFTMCHILATSSLPISFLSLFLYSSPSGPSRAS